MKPGDIVCHVVQSGPGDRAVAAIMAGHMPALGDLALDVAGLFVIAGLLYFLVMMVIEPAAFD